MNLVNPVEERKEVRNFGSIKIIGGENEVDKIQVNRIYEIIPINTASKKAIDAFERSIKEVPTSELKELHSEIWGDIKEYKGALSRVEVSQRYSPQKEIEIITDFDKEAFGKLNCLSYVITKRNIPMTRRKRQFFREDKEKGGKIMNCDLKINDLLTLHIQGALVVGKNNTPTNELEGLKDEMVFIQNIDSIIDSCSVLLPNGKGMRRKAQHISKIKRISLSKRDCKNEVAYSWLRSEKGGSKHEFAPLTRWNKEAHCLEAITNILCLNMVDYTNNHYIYIGTESGVNAILSGLKKRNEEFKGYYNFTGQTLRSCKEFSDKELSPEKRRIVNEKGEVKVIGLNGINKEEKGYLENQRREKGKSPVIGEAKEIIEIAEGQDGRFSDLNLEHAIRFELRDLKVRTASELFYLIKEVEDLVEYEKKNGEYVIKRKHQMLLNVLNGFKGSAEIKEAEQKGLTGDIKDLVVQESDGVQRDANYKRGKNLYSQTLGVLTRNQNPWLGLKDLRSREQIFDPCILISGSQKEVRIKDDGERLLLLTKIVKDAKGNYFEIIDIDSLHAAGLFKRGGSKFTYLFSSSSPAYRDVPEEEYHHYEKKVFDSSNAPRAGISQIERTFRGIDKIFTIPISPKKRENKPILEIKEDKNETKYLIRKTYERNSIRNLTAPSDKENEINKTKYVFEYVPRKVLGLPLVVKGDLSSPFKPSIKKRKYNPMKVSVGNPLDVFNQKVKAIEVGKHRAYPIRRPTEGKNIGEKNKIFYSYPSVYEVIDKKDDVYKIKVEGVSKILYAKGKLRALNLPSISMAGIRQPKRQTINFITDVVCDCVDKGFVTVSGLAEGCDQIVHEDTLSSDGITIGVVPTGFNRLSKNKALAEEIIENKGLILSEYPPHVNGYKRDGPACYHQRNEILVSLSKEVILFEGGRGTMSSFKAAQRLGKKTLVQAINTEINKKMVEEGGELLL